MWFVFLFYFFINILINSFVFLIDKVAELWNPVYNEFINITAFNEDINFLLFDSQIEEIGLKIKGNPFESYMSSLVIRDSLSEELLFKPSSLSLCSDDIEIESIIENNGILVLDSYTSNSIVIKSGWILEWQCDGFCEPICKSGFKINNALLSFNDNSNTFINSSIFDVSFGNVLLKDYHNFQLYDSELKITDGNFTSKNNASIEFIFGILEVIIGNIFLYDNSELRGFNNSELEVYDGIISFDNNSKIIMIESEIDLNGGDLLFSGNSSFISSLYTNIIDNNNNNNNNNNYYNNDNNEKEMKVIISSGSMIFKDTSTASFLNGT